MTWVLRHRRDVFDLASLLASLLLIRCLVDLPAWVAFGAIVAAALVPLRAVHPPLNMWSEFLAALPRRLVSIAVTGILLRVLFGLPLTVLWFGAFWCGFAALPGLKRSPVWNWFRRQVWVGLLCQNEFVRCGVLLFAALWLMRGFARPTLSGTGDALWYGTMLADMVAQVRSGVFPVWAGQSIYQFNGAIYPLRVAPAYHYLGALLDTLTFHRLGVFALQNALIIVLGVGAMATAYFTLRALLPTRRWLAAGLAVLFLSCPGVLGISYNMDLYMSWTTVPLLPLIWFATIRSFQDGGRPATMILLGASLGLSWWGHSPIALWSTLIAGATQVARLCLNPRPRGFSVGIIASGLAFALIAAYPIGSVLIYPPEPGVSGSSFQRATADTVVRFLGQVFPGTFEPLSQNGRHLSDFQLGYALWVLLLLAAGAQYRAAKSAALVPIAVAAMLGVLLLPIPGVAIRLWTLVPGFVRDTTGNWVMNRLYLPLSAATTFGVAAAAAAGLFARGSRAIILAVLVGAGCVWSLLEASKFAAGSRANVRADDSAIDQLRPENIAITRFSYLVFPMLPPTFTHGVTDPELENSLLSAVTMAPIASNWAAAAAVSDKLTTFGFRTKPAAIGGAIELDQPVQIFPGKRYLLQFDFMSPGEVRGVLQLTGKHFFREYLFPAFGESRSFGVGGSHLNSISLWTTADAEDLEVKFFPEASVATADLDARVSLLVFDTKKLPIQVESWIPYRARVQSPATAWLETPRMYQTGYRASIAGKLVPVRKSPDGFVCVAVSSGSCDVEVEYFPPAGLKLLFWISFSAAMAACAAGAWGWILHLLGGPSPAKGSQVLPSV